MRYTAPTRSEWEGWGDPTAVIVAMGIALAAAGIAQTLSVPTSQPVVAFELFVSLLVPTGLATGGIWLARQNVSTDVRWQTAIRVSIGIVVACALGAWLVGYVTLEGGTINDPLSLTTTLAAVGGATGFVTAVRDSTDVSAPDSTVSSEVASAAETGSAATNEQSISTSATGSTMERPTAAAAAATATLTETTTDTAAPSETAMTSVNPASPDALPSARPTTDTTARTADTTAGTATGVWQNADPRGRTAAPAQPADPVRDDEFGSVDDSQESRSWDPTGRNATGSLAQEREYGVDAVARAPSTAETVLEVLQNERARLALAVLYHEWDDEPRSVDHLARAVSYHTDDSADAVAIGLRHSTLPRLEAIRAVDWDPYADRVTASEYAVFEEGVREASVLLESFEPGTR